MKINPDDPKWTAYVLGELGAAERAELEKELESSAAVREVVDDIRMTTSLLKDELAKELQAGLTPQQKRAIGAAAAAKESSFIYTVRSGFRLAAYATVIAVVIASVSIPSLLRSRSAAIESASVAPVPSTVAENQGAQAQFGRYVETAQVKAEAEGVKLEKDEPVVADARISLDALDRPRFNTEAYDFISDNTFIRVAQDPLATFSIDVDTASYANLRRFITNNQLPPKDSVRIEEMINYFTYDYAPPSGLRPIAAYTEVAAAPWQPNHRLVRIAIKGKEVDLSKRPPSNLVFLIDVSGSMVDPQKLPLLKSSMKLMVDRLTENDRVAMVVYAGASGLVLPPTSGDKKAVLISAIDRLESGGSTNGAAGIQLAYDTAVANFIKGGTNRVILATDGDFNVGVTNQGDLTRLIEDKAKSGVFLTVLGFGMGNYKDSTLEKLADRGNGNYAYIDTLNEARKVLVEELGGTLMTIAKDVKVQIEFNPAAVNTYRLIGYENRVLRHEDFNNDQKDAGDMGAGHTVTALFEVVPRGVEMALSTIDTLKYQESAPARADSSARSPEMLNIKIRYKEPDGATSQLLDFPVVDGNGAFNAASTDFQFAAAVASFGMILRDSPYKGQSTFDGVVDMAERGRGTDRGSYRDEFIQLVRMARSLKGIQ